MDGTIPLSLAVQYVIVVLAVTISVWAVLRAQAPALERRLRGALALPLLREGRPAWLRAVGRRLAPRPVIADAACGGCNGCGPKE